MFINNESSEPQSDPTQPRVTVHRNEMKENGECCCRVLRHSSGLDGRKIYLLYPDVPHLASLLLTPTHTFHLCLSQTNLFGKCVFQPGDEHDMWKGFKCDFVLRY